MSSSKQEPGFVKVRFRVARTQWHDHDVEAVWAEPREDGSYRLMNTPFCAYGYSWGDIVSARPDDSGDLFVARVVKRGGHSTYRIIIPPQKAELFDRYWTPIGALGCTFERASPVFLTVDVPPETNLDEAFALLETGEAAGAWSFEEAHCASSNDAESGAE